MAYVYCLILCFGLVSIQAENNYQVSETSSELKPDTLWIQKVLANWTDVCRNELKLKKMSLPWMILYDSTSAWHLNADERMLPQHEKTRYSLMFDGVRYPLIRVAHTKNVWVPDREPIAVSTFLTTTIPYAQHKKAFFIAPVPAFFRTLAPPEQAPFLDFLLLGNTIHELTHTLQLPYVLPQLIKLDKVDKRPSLDDNTVENEFSKNAEYVKIYKQESKLLWDAVFTPDTDSCVAKIKEAFKLMEVRKRRFLTGDNQALGKADEIFLSLEGSAMWAQYRVMLRNAPSPDERALLAWITERSPAWSQERGLALFLLIEKFAPNWKTDFFETELPEATQYLTDLLRKRKRN